VTIWEDGKIIAVDTELSTFYRAGDGTYAREAKECDD